MKRVLCAFICVMIICTGGIALGNSSALAACSHPREYLVKVEEEGFVNRTDDNFHYAYYSIKTICGYCGETVNTEEGGYKAFTHKFGNASSCFVCGEPKPAATCQHTNTQRVLRDNFYNYLNDSYHEKGSVYQDVCISCQKVVRDNIQGSETESHSIVNNQCTKCYYVWSDCNHQEEFVYETGYLQHWVADDSYHLKVQWRTGICKRCGDITSPETEISSSEDHHSYSGNRCTLCNYEKKDTSSVCSHSSTKRVTGTKSYEWIAGNDTHHNVIIPSNTVCNACGKTLSSDKKTETALHSYNGNQCSDCGYEKSTSTASLNTNSYQDSASSSSNNSKRCPSCGWKTDLVNAKFCGFCGTQLTDAAAYLDVRAFIGDIITFGHYEQDGNLANGQEAIDWVVLDKQDGKALVISRYALDYRVYNKAWKELTWETAPMREWLNHDFINTAFTDAEQAMIPVVTVPADRNPDYRTNTGNDTEDQIFLLSIVEADRYFSSDSAMKCKPTAYAKKQGVATNSDGYCWWWLRTVGYNAFDNAYVNRHGGINTEGYYESIKDFAVRPAMWINIAP